MEPFNKSTDAFIKKLKEKADGKTEIKHAPALRQMCS